MPAFYKDLTPYQIAWLENKSPFIVCVKSRRIGISFVEAYKSVLNCLKPDNPRNTYYTSFNFESAKSWLRLDVCYWIERLNLVSQVVEGVELFDPNQRDPIQVSRITFKNGYSIQVLPSKQEVFRGIKGRMVVDEADSVEYLEDMIGSARASLMWGQGQITVISTEGDEDGQFHKLVESVASGEKEGSLISIDLYQACEQNLFKLMCKKNNEIWSAELEQAWILKQIQDFGVYADSELLCIPSKSGSRVFPHELLLKCTGTGDLIIRRDFTAVTNNPNQVTGELNGLFHSLIKPHLEGFNVGRKITAQYLGFDVGRTTDLSSIYVLAKDTVSNKLLTQLVIELMGTPFESQKEFVKLIVGSLPELKSGAVDAVGVGATVAEELSYWCPKIHAVKANATYHDEQWIKLLKLFESQKLSIPNDVLILKDLGGVQFIEGVPRLAKKRSEGRHYDTASSLQLSISTIQGESSKRDGKQPGMVWSAKQKKYLTRI